MIGIIGRWRGGLIALLLVGSAIAWAGKMMAERKAEAFRAKAALAAKLLERERASVAAATTLARAQDAANAARAEHDQIRISREVENAYQKDLAELRRRYDALRLRSGTAGADPRGGADAPVSGISGAAARADGAAAEAGLPARPAELHPADALIASEQALRLQALQEWVRGQSQVVR